MRNKKLVLFKMTLTIIYGPMCSGKTTQMIVEASRYFYLAQKKVLLVVCSLDTRNPKEKISSHFKHFKNLDEIFDIVTLQPSEFKLENIPTGYDLICVDETQFFTNTWPVIFSLKENTNVICSGLKANFKQEPFGDFLNLISMADRTIECHALCSVCKKPAPHTRRTVKDESLVLIGGTDVYQAVCSEHF